MKRMWAPWRMEYILSHKNSDCFLCDALRSDEDEANLVLARGEQAFCMMNRYPYNNGHLLVAPTVHEGELSALGADAYAELWTLTRRMTGVLERAMSPNGFNIGLNLGAEAGAGIPGHLHVHLVPRWAADTNFMPVLADVKIIPQALAELYGQLQKIIGDER